ncbi:hypothetical protein NOGI109294_20295 [Nocardiopsis gilva]
MAHGPRWAAVGVLAHIRAQLRRRTRTWAGKPPQAVAVIVDSQSVKTAETAARPTRGFDAAKKINGRKRHLVVDTRGLPLPAVVTPPTGPTATRAA